jgi:hypothetical protein
MGFPLPTQNDGKDESCFLGPAWFFKRAVLKVLPWPCGNYYFILTDNCPNDIVLPVLFHHCGNRLP